ncbi:hypothetical protein V2J09_007251, partial [Rumex salicifolius]
LYCNDKNCKREKKRTKRTRKINPQTILFCLSGEKTSKASRAISPSRPPKPKLSASALTSPNRRPHILSLSSTRPFWRPPLNSCNKTMPISSSDNRGKWRRKPRDSKATNSKRQRALDEEDDEEEEEDNPVYADEDEDLHPNPKKNLNPNFSHAGPRPEPAPNATPARAGEVSVDGAVRISEFPAVVRRIVNRPHPTVMAFAVAGKQSGVVLENMSHGQLQALSTVPAENASLAMAGDQESLGLFVITPPSIMEGRGVVKKFWNGRIIVVPMHADWFSPTRVHRMERQVVPRFFSGKSVDHTPEKYMNCRNMIVAKYMEHPEKRLLISDCHGMAVGIDLEDMTRIFRFLEHWGIINYCAPVPDHESLSMQSYLKEDATGEVNVPSDALKSIDSLIKFDKPKCRLKAEEVYFSVTSKGDDAVDLEHRIWENLSENRCNSCSKPLILVYYQSMKEPDIMLCPDCYHEDKFVIGHSSMDFTKADSAKDYNDADGDSWSDQETLLLLEAVELYNDNWSDIAEHVGSKSKAQCIVHFLRMPVEDGLLSNLDVPTNAEMPKFTNEDVSEVAHLNTNGNSSGSHIQDSHLDNRLPFANSGNPVMALVAFLASSVGPRVAAACAHASLAALSEGDGLSPSEITPLSDGSVPSDRRIPNDGPNGEVRDSASYKGSQASRNQNNAETTTLSAKKVEFAAKAGLAAAAVKAKLFADHEEREIQRLSANIINHQLKRLELKLKQFAEVETLLMKECEQVEKTRQRFALERARYMGPQFGSPGVSSPVSHPGVSPSMVNTNNLTGNRPTQLISPSPSSQPSMSGYNQMNHPNMPFMPRQPMYPYGPRPMMQQQQQQPSPSSQSPNSMFSPQGSGQSPLSRPMVRPLPGSSSSLG